jgi:heme/copper-type cytochrome/quinol oxidase subunit 3
MTDVPLQGPGTRSPHGVQETAEEIAFGNRAAEAALFIGSRMLIAIYAFAFAALAFAYFYLRSSNGADLWRPGHVTAPTAAGAAIMAFVVAGTAFFWYGVTKLRRDQIGDWEVAGWIAVSMVLAAVAVQCWELAALPFAPGSSGYSSVFVAWAGMNLFLLVSTAYWSETLVTRSARLRRGRAEEGGDGKGLTPSIARVNVEAAAAFWVFTAVVSLFFWVFFYLA